MKIYLKHLRVEPRYCIAGTKLFFDRMGWDWSDFVKNGIDVEKVINTGDAMAINLAERVKNG